MPASFCCMLSILLSMAAGHQKLHATARCLASFALPFCRGARIMITLLAAGFIIGADHTLSAIHACKWLATASTQPCTKPAQIWL